MHSSAALRYISRRRPVWAKLADGLRPTWPVDEVLQPSPSALGLLPSNPLAVAPPPWWHFSGTRPYPKCAPALSWQGAQSLVQARSPTEQEYVALSWLEWRGVTRVRTVAAGAAPLRADCCRMQRAAAYATGTDLRKCCRPDLGFVRWPTAFQLRG